MNSPRRTSIRIPTLFQSDTPLVTMLFSVTGLLVGFGLLMVLSASSVSSGITNNGNFLHDATIQLGGAAIGAVLALFAARLPITFWQRWQNAFVVVGLLLQSLVLFTPLGISYGGNRNWLDLGFVTVQPSEFIKLAIIVWLAVWIHDNPDFIDRPLFEWKQPGIWVGIPFATILLGGDLGTSIILGFIILGMLLVAGMPARPIIAMSSLAFVAAIALISFSSRRDRFISWIVGCSPADYEGVCWQNIHGYWALGSGGLFGRGAGSSRSKWSWLPHADSDYIFAIIGEEFGLLGAMFLLAILVVLAVTLVRLMREYPQALTRTLIAGVLIWLVGQSLVNIAVVLGLLPVLGVPLPMLSSGGSAIMANLLAIGVVVSCVRYEERYG